VLRAAARVEHRSDPSDPNPLRFVVYVTAAQATAVNP